MRCSSHIMWAMICPNEGAEMRPVKTQSHVAQTIFLDQCPDCGGIWFDRSELYRARDGEAAKVEALDEAGLVSPTIMTEQTRRCPRDGTELARFTDPYFPQGIIVERCPSCDGFWLNRGEFTKYQDARRRRKMPREVVVEDSQLQRKMGEVMATHRDGGANDSVLKVAKFLSMPLDRQTLQPLEPEKLSPEEQDAFTVVMNVVATVLSSFLLR